MPSGAKRRKAAKKKKQKEASSSANHSHGEDEVNRHDEKESDGGGVDSSTSQEHRGEEVEKREDIPSVQSMVSKSEPAEGTGINGESAVVINESNVIKVEWDFKPEEEDPGSKTDEYVKESHKDKSSSSSRSSSSSSSSSSSDDESFTDEKNVVIIESGEPEKDVHNVAVESGALAELVTTDGSSEVTLATDAIPAEDSSSLPAALQKDLHVNDYAHSVSSVDLADLPEVTQVTDSAPVVEADSSIIATSTEEAYNAIAQALMSNEVEHVLDSNVSDLGTEENGKSKISELTQVVTDMGSQPMKKEVPSTEVENSTVEGFLSREKEDKLLPASSVPAIDISNGTEQSKDDAVTECSEKQPLVASAPRPVQTTSWSGCCGLFELFTGSNR